MIGTIRSLARTLFADETASMAIETALVTPVLVIMTIGGFEASSMVARQSELQAAAAEAAAIALANPPDSYEEIQTIRDVIKASTGLSNDEVVLYRRRRCGTDSNYVIWENACDDGDDISTFVYIYIEDTYTPEWVNFGVGDPVTYRIRRMVQIS